MSSPSQVAAGFTITGLLDGASRTRGRYPVSEIAVADIADHPANAAYSMDPTGIAELAESIREDGLTDLPLVRKVGDGSWQMVSGHRRKAAYALLAKDDPAYEKMPCRVIEGIDDERAVTLLHAANYFTRALTVTERAAATEALRGDAVRLRSEDPSLSGMRVDDVKAAIIERQTGRKVSGGLATLMWTVPGGAREAGGPYMRDPRHPRHFTDEFKRQIVDLYNAGKPKREIMDEYDLGKSTVERWIKSINATGSPRAACNRTPEQNRILELERENRRLRMEVDVLKQAALIYARK